MPEVVVLRDINCPEDNKTGTVTKAKEVGMAVPKSAQTRIVVIITYIPTQAF